jgi:hypothetical protein
VIREEARGKIQEEKQKTKSKKQNPKNKNSKLITKT